MFAANFVEHGKYINVSVSLTHLEQPSPNLRCFAEACLSLLIVFCTIEHLRLLNTTGM
ncbi:hypothetical protein AAC387_Pa05g0682 [Persea americana]